MWLLARLHTPCEQSLFYRFFEETEKEALHKSASSFEFAVAPNLGLVIPVYGCQTGFTSASISFYEKHGGEALAKGGRLKTLDLLTRSLSSLSPLGQILSCPCPRSLITENLSFYKLINVR